MSKTGTSEPQPARPQLPNVAVYTVEYRLLEARRLLALIAAAARSARTKMQPDEFIHVDEEDILDAIVAAAGDAHEWLSPVTQLPDELLKTPAPDGEESEEIERGATVFPIGARR